MPIDSFLTFVEVFVIACPAGQCSVNDDQYKKTFQFTKKVNDEK
jgi:hypothetical protein